MYPPMRRIKNELSIESVRTLLKSAEYGTLALNTPENFPYSLPMSYVFHDNAIYLHGAKEGFKMKSLLTNPKVSFSVVGKTQILPEKFTTKYESVIVFGRVLLLEEGPEKREALFKFIKKYSSDFLAEGQAYIERSGNATAIIKIDIEHMTGKSNF